MNIKERVFYKSETYTHRLYIKRVSDFKIAKKIPMKLFELYRVESDVLKLAMRFTENPRQCPEELAVIMCRGNEDWEECRVFYEIDEYNTLI